LIPHRITIRPLPRVRPVQRLTKLAPINFRPFTHQLLNLRRILEPPLQMSCAHFPLGIFLIASPLLGLPRFHLRRPNHFRSALRLRSRILRHDPSSSFPLLPSLLYLLLPFSVPSVFRSL